MIPSVKTLEAVTHDHESAKLLREILEANFFPRSGVASLVHIWENDERFACIKYYGRKTFSIKLDMADKLIPMSFGVEYIPAGRNKRSPAIWYCNTGDPYHTTLMHINGRYRVGCWGDIVERGNYD